MTTEIPLHDLPIWMRQARQGVDWGILLVIAFCLCLAWSFVVQPGVPITNASQNYAFMASDFTQAFREGVLYPRWSPHAFEGYGAPIPNYLPPGAAYIVALVETFITSSTLVAIRLVYALALCGAGAASYALVTRWMGAGGGILASLLYVYNPYIGFTAPHLVGDLPGVIGLALLPLLLWAITRMLLMNRPIDVALIALITAAMILTDTRMFLITIFTVITMAVWYRRGGQHKHHVYPIFFAILIGMGLSSFYWFPALFDQSAIYWRPPVVQQPVYQLTFPNTFAPLQQVDPAALVPAPQFTLGWICLVMAVLGALGIILRPQQNLFPALFFGIGGFLLLLALTILRRETWLLGPIALYFAVGSSAALSLRLDLLKQAKHLLLPGLIVIILLGSPSVWLSPYWLNTTFDVSPKAQIEYEQQGWGVAVLPSGVFVPTTLRPTTPSNRFVVNSYQIGNIAKIPPDLRLAQIQAIFQGTHEGRYRVFSDREMRITVLIAYFPGWAAYLDGSPLPVFQNLENSLLDVIVPATRGGGGELRIVLEDTPLRASVNGFSMAVGLLLIVLTVRRVRKSRGSFHDLHLLNPSESRFAGLLLICFVVVLFFSAAPSAVIPLRAQPGLAGTTPLRISTNVGLQLLSFDLDNQTFRPGEAIDLTLYWRALRFLPDNYRVRIALQDVNRGTTSLETSLRHPGGFPTRRWSPNGYISDQYRLNLPYTALPGNYQIIVEALNCQLDCNDEARLTFFNASDPDGSKTFLLPQIITITSR